MLSWIETRQTPETRHRRRQAQPWRIVPPFASAVLTDGRDGAGGDCAPPLRLDGRRRRFLLSSDAPCMQRAAGGVTLAGDSYSSAARVSFPPRPRPTPGSAAVLAALVRSGAGAAVRHELATSGSEAGGFRLRGAVDGDGWL